MSFYRLQIKLNKKLWPIVMNFESRETNDSNGEKIIWEINSIRIDCLCKGPSPWRSRCSIETDVRTKNFQFRNDSAKYFEWIWSERWKINICKNVLNESFSFLERKRRNSSVSKRQSVTICLKFDMIEWRSFYRILEKNFFVIIDRKIVWSSIGETTKNKINSEILKKHQSWSSCFLL